MTVLFVKALFIILFTILSTILPSSGNNTGQIFEELVSERNVLYIPGTNQSVPIINLISPQAKNQSTIPENAHLPCLCDGRIFCTCCAEIKLSELNKTDNVCVSILNKEDSKVGLVLVKDGTKIIIVDMLRNSSMLVNDLARVLFENETIELTPLAKRDLTRAPPRIDLPVCITIPLPSIRPQICLTFGSTRIEIAHIYTCVTVDLRLMFTENPVLSVRIVCLRFRRKNKLIDIYDR